MLITIAGPMFAGKTRYLIETCKAMEQKHGHESLVALVPPEDTRSGSQLKAHDGSVYTAYQIPDQATFQRVLYPRPNLRLVVVEEVQFFDAWIVRELRLLANRVKEVHAAGLLHDAQGIPFENVRDLIPLSDRVIHKTAMCVLCGESAAWTRRKDPSKTERVEIGGEDLYDPVCRRHFEMLVPDRWAPDGIS